MESNSDLADVTQQHNSEYLFCKLKILAGIYPPFFEMQLKSKEGKSCFFSFSKGKKGIIKLQAVYWMENVIFFTRNEKEIRELVVKVLEARVKGLDSCCTARK
jgi:hypothetical protein